MNSIKSLLQRKLIPWAEDNLEQRLIVARPVMKKTQLPFRVELKRDKIVGKRVVVQNRRYYGNQRLYRAHWIEAGLHELEVPKLVCVTRGTADFRIGDYIVTCGEGHFILLPPHTPDSCNNRSHLEGERRENGFCDLLQFLFFRDSIQCWPCYSRGEEHFNDPTGHLLIRHHQAVQLFHLFEEEALHREEGHKQITGHLLPAFFTLLVREITAGRSLGLLSNAPEHSSDVEPIQEIRDYIKNHLNQDLTIEKVARQVYMSPAQFTRHIRQQTGRSFVDILTECRLEEAKILLRETKISVSMISELVGFKSNTYFSGLFRRLTGVPPGAFRQKYAVNKIGEED